MPPHALPLKLPPNRDLLGGDLLAQSLHALGVRVLFGLHGGHLDAFLMGCADMGMRLVDTRHETVAVQAAEGFCNGIPGLATAFADRSPILCITSSPPLRDAESNALQGTHDQVVLAKPMTKFAHRITVVEEIPRLASLAYRTACSGTPGPVLLDVPIDVLFTPVDDVGRVTWGNITAPLASRPGPDPRAVRELLGLLEGAERPVVIIGTGAKDAIPALSTLAQTLSLPIFHSPKFSTTFPRTHALNCGSAASLALLPALGHPQPDLVLLAGARTGFILGGRSGAIIPNSGCTVAQIDIDGGEIGRISHVDLGVVSDVGLAIEALNGAALAVSAGGPGVKDKSARESWVKLVRSLKDFRAPHTEAEDKIDAGNGALHPYHAMARLFPLLPAGSILSFDGGEAACWASQCLPFASPALSMVPTGYLGFLGNGWGYCLGAAVAEPSALVVNVQGDGSAGFHVAELDTYVRHGLRVLTVVVNNSVWGMSLSGQDLLYGEQTPMRNVSKLSSEMRFDAVARGFGMQAFHVDAADPECRRATAEETFAAAGAALERAVKTVVESGKSGLIDLRVSPTPAHDATKAMVGDTKLEPVAQDFIIVSVLIFFIASAVTMVKLFIGHRTRAMRPKPVDMEMGAVGGRNAGQGAGNGHMAHPSLEHGPGPTIFSNAPVASTAHGEVKEQAHDVNVVPATPLAVNMQTSEGSGGTRLEHLAPDTLDGSSSLRRAVLDIGGEAEAKKNEAVAIDGEKAGNVDDKKKFGVGERKSRGYSGAWP
ncbi:hypothetical protein J1614_000012 [Plenodomus biglobosus]|nr:hypothetical protein J1614_000012 [Plenodomus biglobosus]